LAPSTGGLLRLYGLTASQVVSTGPRGHILKEDVLAHVKANNLSKLDLKSHKQEAAVAATPAPAAPKPTKKPV